MNKKLFPYAFAFFVVVIFFLYFLFFSPFSVTSAGAAEPVAETGKYDWDSFFSRVGRPEPKNLYSALDDGNVLLCGSLQGVTTEKCEMIFFLASEICPEGKAIDKIFCLAFLEKNPEYCGLIALPWYSGTCHALVEEDILKCTELGSLEYKSLCVRDLALNLEDPGCAVLPADWRILCESQNKQDQGKCGLISNLELKKQCLELFNI